MTVTLLAERVDSAELTIGDWFLQLSPLGAAILTFGVAFIQWRTAVAMNKESLKPVLEQALKDSSANTRAIVKEFKGLQTSLLEAIRGLVAK